MLRGEWTGTLAVLSRVMERGIFFVSFYNHLFISCSQDWFSVLSILESLLITVRSSNPKVKKAYLKSDEAGCYHNNQLIVAARDVGERGGVSLQRYDFSEPQSGNWDVCDRILWPLKGAIRRYCNEGHDVLTASDMHTALKERPVQGCIEAVCRVNETKKGLDIKKLQHFSAMHDFSYHKTVSECGRHSKLALANSIRGMKFTLSIKAPPIL